MRLPCSRDADDVLLDFFPRFVACLGQHFHPYRAPRRGWDNQHGRIPSASSSWDLEKSASDGSHSRALRFYAIFYLF